MQTINQNLLDPGSIDQITNEQLVAEALSGDSEFAGIFKMPADPLIDSILDAMELLPRSSLSGYRAAINKSFILDKDPIRVKMGYPLCGSGDLFITDSRGLCKNSPHDEDSIIRMQKARETNTPIIMFFGGSTIMGEGAKSPRLSIPAQVEKILRDAGKDTVCINFGLLGSFSCNALSFLVAEGLVENPHTVIFYDGWNCLHEFKLNQLINISRGNFDIKTFAGPYLNIHQVKNDIQLNQTFRLSYMTSRVAGLMAVHLLSFIAKALPSRSVRALMAKLTIKFWDAGSLSQNKLVNLFDPNDPNFDRRNLTIKSAKEYIQTHILAKKFTESLGCKYITILQPLLFWGNKNLTKNEVMYLQDSPPFSDQEDYRIFHEALVNQATEINLQDFTDIFDQINEEVYYDQGHLNASGNFIVATRISKYLLNNL